MINHRHRRKVFLVVALLSAAALGIGLYAAFTVSRDTSDAAELAAELAVVTQRLEEQLTETRRLNRRIEAISQRNCRQLEDLKQKEREDAQDGFAQLDETLMVLGLVKTPQLVKLAQRELAEDLARLKRLPCPQLGGTA